jgi:PAS domain S-box-containing protein
MPDSIFAKDTEGRYLFANKAFAAIHGMTSPEGLLGKTVFDLLPKDQAGALHADDLLVMRAAGAPVETERTAVDVEGRAKVLQTTKVALIDRNEKVIGVVGLHRDVTRRKEAEQKLRQSEANLAAAQRIAHFGSVELDIPTIHQPEKKPVRWSDEVFRIFGIEPRSVEPSRELYFRSVHPEDREKVREALDRAMTDVKPFTVDFRIVRPDGTQRNLQERGDILLDPSTHKPLKLVASIQDVTELVQAELRLQRANKELGERLRELQQRSREINILSEMGSRLQVCNSADEAYTEINHAAEQLFPEWR